MCITRKPRGNTIRGPLNALFFTVFDGYINRLLGERKSRLFADLPRTVVELGSGVGANFCYLKPGTKVTAIEPNRFMHKRLTNRASKCGIGLSLLACNGEAIELADSSADAVICTLVLCTVDDPVRVLREIRRILKPGGRFIFIEHVAAADGTWRRRLQETLLRPWRYAFEGCRLNRDTRRCIETAGFRRVEIDAYTMRSPFIPVNTQIAGVATA